MLLTPGEYIQSSALLTAALAITGRASMAFCRRRPQLSMYAFYVVLTVAQELLKSCSACPPQPTLDVHA